MISALHYKSTEDGVEDTIKVNLENMHGDCKRVCFISKNDLVIDDNSIEQAIIKTKAELLVLDPIQSFISKGKSTTSANGMREAPRGLAQIASKHKCTVLLIGHLVKSIFHNANMTWRRLHLIFIYFCFKAKKYGNHSFFFYLNKDGEYLDYKMLIDKTFSSRDEAKIYFLSQKIFDGKSFWGIGDKFEWLDDDGSEIC